MLNKVRRPIEKARGSISRGPKGHITIEAYNLVLRPKTRGIPETMASRIFLIMWSFGPVVSSVKSQALEVPDWSLGGLLDSATSFSRLVAPKGPRIG